MSLSVRHLAVLGCPAIVVGLILLWLNQHAEYGRLTPIAILVGAVLEIVLVIYMMNAAIRKHKKDLEDTRNAAQGARREALTACASIIKTSAVTPRLEAVISKLHEDVSGPLTKQWAGIRGRVEEVESSRTAIASDPGADPYRQQTLPRYAVIRRSYEVLGIDAQSVSEELTAFLGRLEALETAIVQAPKDYAGLKGRYEAMVRRIDELMRADYRVGLDDDLEYFEITLDLVRSLLDGRRPDGAAEIILSASDRFGAVEQSLCDLGSARSGLQYRHQLLVARRSELSEKAGDADRRLSQLRNKFIGACLLDVDGLVAGMRRLMAAAETPLANAADAMSMKQQDWTRAHSELDRAELTLNSLADCCVRFDQESGKLQTLPSAVQEALKATACKIADTWAELGSNAGDNQESLAALQKLEEQLERLNTLASAKRPHYNTIIPSIRVIDDQVEVIFRRAKAVRDRTTKQNREGTAASMT